jgi:hypothetical protein
VYRGLHTSDATLIRWKAAVVQSAPGDSLSASVGLCRHSQFEATKFADTISFSLVSGRHAVCISPSVGIEDHFRTPSASCPTCEATIRGD